MKTFYTILICSFTFLSVHVSAQTRTSVANGDWYNPTTWSPAGVPGPTDNDIIVNTNVTFSQNILISPQNMFRVNSGASLMNLTGVDTIVFAGASFDNRGYMSAGVLVGEVDDTTYNSGTISLTLDFIQSGITWNKASGVVCCGQKLVIGQDMLNDGSMSCMMLINSDNMTGNGGKYCVSQSLLNSATISGTVDVCDATPGQFNDILGTVAGTVTFCAAGPCTVCQPNSVNEISTAIEFAISPNPFSSELMITIEHAEGRMKFELYDMNGKLIRSEQFSGNSLRIERGDLPSGLYLVRIADEKGRVTAAKIAAE